MTSRTLTAATLFAGLLAFAAGAVAAEARIDLGKREFESNCAVCHGKDGRGNGPYAGLLTTRLPDLTTLTKRNGGVFPLQRVIETIDGGPTVTAHGTRDMPIWGAAYRLRAAEHYIDTPYDADAYVRARILALAEYLNRLQAR